MTEASKRPWRALPATPVVDSKGSNVIVCRCGKAITDDQAKYSMDRWMADAALIVRAVNAHDALVAALEDIAAGSGAYSLDPLTHAGNCIDDMKATARAALALAKEPAP